VKGERHKMLNDLSNDMAIMHSSEQTAEDREREMQTLGNGVKN